MKVDRLAGGLWCHDVLERLSDYLDGELSAEERQHVEAHLRGCEECTTFGGEFARTVGALRQHLLHEDTAPLPEGLRSRLLSALERAQAPSSGGDAGE